MKIKAVLGNQKLEEKLVRDLKGETGNPPELLVISRKWEKGGTEDLVGEVKKAVYEGCSYVVPVLGREDSEAQRLQGELETFGVPREAVLYGNPVRYSQLLQHVETVLARQIAVDPVIWSETETEGEGADDIVYCGEESGKPKGEKTEKGGIQETRAGARPATLDKGLDEQVHPAEKRHGPKPEGQKGSGDRKHAKIVWFMSPVAGTGQTTLVSSAFALQAEITKERLALIDFCQPAATYLKFGDPEFEDKGSYFITTTQWGDLIVPKDPHDPETARQFAESVAGHYDWVYVDTPPGWKTEWFDITVTVIGENPEQYQLLRNSGLGKIIVLNNVRYKGPNFLQGVLRNEFGRTADVVVLHDPEVSKAVEIPAVLKSDAVAKGAGEIISLLAGVA